MQTAAIAEFEYRFDVSDYDAAMLRLTKANSNQHANALTVPDWLQRNHETSSCFFVNHPSREAIAWKDLWFYSNPIFVYR